MNKKYLKDCIDLRNKLTECVENPVDLLKNDRISARNFYCDEGISDIRQVEFCFREFGDNTNEDVGPLNIYGLARGFFSGGSGSDKKIEYVIARITDSSEEPSDDLKFFGLFDLYQNIRSRSSENTYQRRAESVIERITFEPLFFGGLYAEQKRYGSEFKGMDIKRQEKMSYDDFIELKCPYVFRIGSQKTYIKPETWMK